MRVQRNCVTTKGTRKGRISTSGLIEKHTAHFTSAGREDEGQQVPYV